MLCSPLESSSLSWRLQLTDDWLPKDDDFGNELLDRPSRWSDEDDLLIEHCRLRRNVFEDDLASDEKEVSAHESFASNLLDVTCLAATILFVFQWWKGEGDECLSCVATDDIVIQEAEGKWCVVGCDGWWCVVVVRTQRKNRMASRERKTKRQSNWQHQIRHRPSPITSYWITGITGHQQECASHITNHDHANTVFACLNGWFRVLQKLRVTYLKASSALLTTWTRVVSAASGNEKFPRLSKQTLDTLKWRKATLRPQAFMYTRTWWSTTVSEEDRLRIRFCKLNLDLLCIGGSAERRPSTRS